MSQYLLYLHGFNSSPLSDKGKVTQQFLIKKHPDVKIFFPQIASNPNAAKKQLLAIVEQVNKTDHHASWSFVGSSLGGYFATYLAEKFQGQAVLINPAVKPYELLTTYIGEQENPYTQEKYQVSESFIEHLKVMEQVNITENNYLILIQTGDEVLDYQQAVNKYKNAHLIIQQGGDHSFVGFENMLPDIVKFFQLS